MLYRRRLFLLVSVYVICLVNEGFSQNRIVLNNDAFLVMQGSVKIIIENPNPDAITTTGSGGNIVSEGEENELRWVIGTNTGTYIVPFTTRPAAQGGNSTKIPVRVDITGAGIGSGYFGFSTYETATDVNTAYPATVTHVNSGGADASLKIVDRFWKFGLGVYSTKPSVIMSLTYDDAANEIGGTNTIVESMLRAQRWNGNVGDWESLMFGTTDDVVNVTSGIAVNGSDFHEIWTLVEATAPLPVELVQFNFSCNQGAPYLTWKTVSERDNDYFIITASEDGVNFDPIGVVDGAGNSQEEINYEYIDSEARSEKTYFQLIQVDFDGKTHLSPIITSKNCNSKDLRLYPNPANDIVYLNLGGTNASSIKLLDAQGRLIQQVNDCNESTILDISAVHPGTYIVQVISNNRTKTVRFIKR